MIKIEKEDVYGFNSAFRGMRNPMNSWHLSDGKYKDGRYEVGDVDLKLAIRLSKAGTDHRKFMRMIVVYVDVTAPLYWWKEMDTYKVGTVSNSCSTMHKITSKPITLSDFSIEETDIGEEGISMSDCFINVVADCEMLRKYYLETKDKRYWRGLIQLLPSSYNQKRTLQLNYEVLANIYQARKYHKLDEWQTFCDWIERLPHSELITGEGV